MSDRRPYAVMGAAIAVVVGVVALALVLDRPGAAEEQVSEAVAAETGAVEPVESLAGPVDTAAPLATAAPSLPLLADDDCEVSGTLREGADTDEVACLQTALVRQGFLAHADVEATFGPATADALRRFQTDATLDVDAVAGRHTLTALGIWAGPPPPDAETCVDDGRSIVVDRRYQRAWFCEDGRIENQIPVTSAWSQPDPGRYSVYAKDLDASSNLTDTFVRMTHFVAFTRGKVSNARIAFHSVPTYSDGTFAQPLETVGDLGQRGDSEGCIRVLPDDAQAIWDWLSVGDEVRVIT